MADEWRRWSRQEVVRVQERKKNRRTVISQSEGSSGAFMMGCTDSIEVSDRLGDLETLPHGS